MDSEHFSELPQKGFRIVLGATVSLIEMVQNANKRDAAQSQLQTDLDRLADEFATKGEAIEQETRQAIEHFLAKFGMGEGQANLTATTSESPPSVYDLIG